jgi:uncharacterized membrane protein YccC
MSLRDRLLASDPPLERLRLALRSIAAVLLAGLPLLGLSALKVLPPTCALLGALVAWWVTLQANDPDLGARKITSAVLPLGALFGVAFAALLDAISPVLGAIGLVALSFPGIWLRRYGPRGMGLGMMALLVTFWSLFVQTPVAQILPSWLAIVWAGVAAWIAHFVLVPDSARVALQGARVALRARIRLFLEAVREVAAAGGHELRRASVALDGAALAVDRVVAGPALALDDRSRDEVRLAVLDAQLAADRLGALAVAAPDDDAALDAALDTMRVEDRLAAERLDRALRAPATPHADAPIAPPPRPPDIGGLTPPLRQAIQVTAAAAAATAIGTAVPPHEPYWAVLTAYLVYNQIASSGEARRRAAARTGGTVLGVLIGAGIVALVHGHAPIEFALLAVCMCAAMYTFRQSYFVFTVFLVGVVAVAYDLAGRPTDQLLLSRLVETLVGGACGALAATYIVPLHTGAVVAVHARAFAEKVRASIDASVARLRGDRGARPLDAVRDVDAQMQELLARLRPLVEGPRRAQAGGADDALSAIVECAYDARVLARDALAGAPDALERVAPLQEVLDRATRSLRAMIEASASRAPGAGFRRGSRPGIAKL